MYAIELLEKRFLFCGVERCLIDKNRQSLSYSTQVGRQLGLSHESGYYSREEGAQNLIGERDP